MTLAPTTTPDPDRAVRARLNAAIIDLLLIGILTRLVVAAIGIDAISMTALALIYVIQFAYFFGQEARGGQTLGKRAMHVRVVALDGLPATLRMCAIRNVLRFLDAFPLLYTSGLVSLIRTGRRRRQRLGDVVAATTVVTDGTQRPLATPRWLLPVTALVALSASAAVLWGTHAESVVTKNGDPIVRGFAGGSAGEPRTGLWQVNGTYLNAPASAPLQRIWQITRTCDHTCRVMLTRQVDGEAPISATLTRHADGWHGTFAPRELSCATTAQPEATWEVRSAWVLRFSPDGQSVEAHERNVFHSAACGWVTNELVWTGSLR